MMPKSRLTAGQLHATTRQWAENERSYRNGSHGKRSQALMAYATAGYEAPADAIMISESMEVEEMSEKVLNEIIARLERIEQLLANGAAVSAVGALQEFPAVSLSATVDDGKVYWKVKGGRFTKFGASIWPEVLDLTPFKDASPLKSHDLTGYTAVYSEDEQGRPKVVGLRPPAAAANGTNGDPEYQSYADAAQPVVNHHPKQGKTAEKKRVGKDAAKFAAGHWLKVCQTATDPLMFDSAMTKLAPFFPDANGVQWTREQVFGSWVSADAMAVTAGLLAYAAKREELNGAVSKVESHAQAAAEAREAFEKVMQL